MEHAPKSEERKMLENLPPHEAGILRTLAKHVGNLIEEVQTEGYEDLEEDMHTISRTIGDLNNEEAKDMLEKKVNDFAGGLSEDKGSEKFAESLATMAELKNLLAL